MLHQLNSFICVADEGKISKAAEKLFISPQALTQQINSLERTVGFQLFRRGKSGVSLTEAGRHFYETSVSMVAEYDSAIRVCRQLVTEMTELNVPIPTDMMSRDMEALSLIVSRDYPSIRLNFIKTDVSPAMWPKLIRDGGMDVAQYYTAEKQPLEGVRSIEMEHSEPLWCLIATDSPLANKTRIIPEDLHGMRIAANPLSTMRALEAYMRENHLEAEFTEVPLNRYSIIDACKDKGVVIFLKEIVSSFPILKGIPLDFDSEISYGLLYSEDAAPEVVSLVRSLADYYASTHLEESHLSAED